MLKVCANCGKQFASQRASAKYCGDNCRQAAARSRKNGNSVVALPATQPAATSPDTIYGATLARLEEAGVADSPAALIALAISLRIDAGQTSDNGLAALAKAHETALQTALTSTKRADQMDEVAKRRDEKLNRARGA